MSWCKEAVIAAINLCFRPFSCLPLINQCEKDSSEVYKMDKWPEMLPDILEEISDRLPLRDFVTFRGVCRHWRSAPSGRSEITVFSKERPWLMFYDFDRKSSNVVDDTCYLYNRPDQNCCAVRLPHLRGATIMHSKAGWLFVRSRGGHFFLYNPLTLTRMDLPKHIVVEEQVCTMTTTPTVQNNCTVFIVSRRTDSALEISTCRIGDTDWKVQMAEISTDRIGTMRAAYVCGCADGHNPEACGLRIEHTISIAASKKSLVYDYMNKRCVNEWTADARAQVYQRARAAGKVFFWDEDMQSPVHHKNWLKRFGEKGISISTSTISTRRADFIGHSSRYYRVDAGESGSTVEHKWLRASWIEPIFGG